jgi:hypothetical protein
LLSQNPFWWFQHILQLWFSISYFKVFLFLPLFFL